MQLDTFPDRPLPPLPGVTHRFVDADGLRVHVAEAGSGPPLLMLHGWPQHWYCFHRVLPLLAEHFRVICPDMRGFGWSEAPRGGYRTSDLALDAAAVLDALDIDAAHVAGHDWGGVAAYALAVEHPERVTRLVALNTGHLWPRRGVRRLETAVRAAAYQPFIATPILGRQYVRHVAVPLMAQLLRRSGTWTPVAADSYTAQLADPARVRASVELYRGLLTRDLPRWLAGRYEGRRVAAPTLALHGTGDPVLRPSILDGLGQHVPLLRTELLEDADHFVLESAPERVAQLMTRFLRAPASGRGAHRVGGAVRRP